MRKPAIFILLILNSSNIGQTSSVRKTHIVLIVADDLVIMRLDECTFEKNAVFSHFKTLQHFFFNQGWNDVGFHGSNQIPTPNIDSLAWDGLLLHTYHLLIIIITITVITVILDAIRSGPEQLLCQPNLHSEQKRLANWQTPHSYR